MKPTIPPVTKSPTPTRPPSAASSRPPRPRSAPMGPGLLGYPATGLEEEQKAVDELQQEIAKESTQPPLGPTLSYGEALLYQAVAELQESRDNSSDNTGSQRGAEGSGPGSSQGSVRVPGVDEFPSVPDYHMHDGAVTAEGSYIGVIKLLVHQCLNSIEHILPQAITNSQDHQVELTVIKVEAAQRLVETVFLSTIRLESERKEKLVLYLKDVLITLTKKLDQVTKKIQEEVPNFEEQREQLKGTVEEAVKSAIQEALGLPEELKNAQAATLLKEIHASTKLTSELLKTEKDINDAICRKIDELARTVESNQKTLQESLTGMATQQSLENIDDTLTEIKDKLENSERELTSLKSAASQSLAIIYDQLLTQGEDSASAGKQNFDQLSAQLDALQLSVRTQLQTLNIHLTNQNQAGFAGTTAGVRLLERRVLGVEQAVTEGMESMEQAVRTRLASATHSVSLLEGRVGTLETAVTDGMAAVTDDVARIDGTLTASLDPTNAQSIFNIIRNAVEILPQIIAENQVAPLTDAQLISIGNASRVSLIQTINAAITPLNTALGALVVTIGNPAGENGNGEGSTGLHQRIDAVTERVVASETGLQTTIQTGLQEIQATLEERLPPRQTRSPNGPDDDPDGSFDPKKAARLIEFGLSFSPFHKNSYRNRIVSRVGLVGGAHENGSFGNSIKKSWYIMVKAEVDLLAAISGYSPIPGKEHGSGKHITTTLKIKNLDLLWEQGKTDDVSYARVEASLLNFELLDRKLGIRCGLGTYGDPEKLNIVSLFRKTLSIPKNIWDLNNWKSLKTLWYNSDMYGHGGVYTDTVRWGKPLGLPVGAKLGTSLYFKFPPKGLAESQPSGVVTGSPTGSNPVKQNEMSSELTELKTDLKGLQQGAESNKKDLTELKNSTKSLKNDFSSLTSSIKKIEKQGSEIGSKIDKLAEQEENCCRTLAEKIDKLGSKDGENKAGHLDPISETVFKANQIWEICQTALVLFISQDLIVVIGYGLASGVVYNVLYIAQRKTNFYALKATLRLLRRCIPAGYMGAVAVAGLNVFSNILLKAPISEKWAIFVKFSEIPEKVHNWLVENSGLSDSNLEKVENSGKVVFLFVTWGPFFKYGKEFAVKLVSENTAVGALVLLLRVTTSFVVFSLLTKWWDTWLLSNDPFEEIEQEPVNWQKVSQFYSNDPFEISQDFFE